MKQIDILMSLKRGMIMPINWYLKSALVERFGTLANAGRQIGIRENRVARSRFTDTVAGMWGAFIVLQFGSFVFRNPTTGESMRDDSAQFVIRRVSPWMDWLRIRSS